jgi:hypothetical protein
MIYQSKPATQEERFRMVRRMAAERRIMQNSAAELRKAKEFQETSAKPRPVEGRQGPKA